ncbi:MAG: SDR family NAD(P)-dependent oxidoreductase [Rhodocyclaceae bacterium]|nr:SDR family NAD(P)-dependent oxidoreductase [Rhodocyclaceae bacterium]
MNWNGKRVLVTGAGGFIGSHLAERLTELGAETRALVRYTSNGHWGWLDTSPRRDDMEVILGDIRDRDSVRQAMRDVDVVFHLAALIGIPYSYHAPDAYVQTNVVGTLNVLQTARDYGTGRVVHTSTSEVYGTARYVPIDEKHPLQGQSPYSASKIGADKLAESFFLSFALPVVTVRPFNTYGPRQSARAVIPTIATQCLAGQRTIRLGNLEPTRDLSHVSDTVAGFLAAATSPQAIGNVLNLGNGKEISIGELAHRIARLSGTDVAIECDGQRVRPTGSEVERLLADNRQMLALTGWAPRISLDEGLRDTIGWIRENMGRFRVGAYSV